MKVTNHRAALFASTLFAVHPLHTDAVASCVGLSEPLSLTFVLLTFVLHTSHNKLSRFITPITFALALFAKESSVLFLPIIAAYDLSLRHRSLRENTLRYGLFSLSLSLYLFTRTLSLGRTLSLAIDPVANPLAHASPLSRLLYVPALFGHGLSQLIAPAVLLPDYGTTTIVINPFPYALTLVGTLSLFAFIALAIAHRRDPLTVLAVSWLVIPAWAASNGLVRLPVLYAERLWYGPSVGACLLSAIAFVYVSRYARERLITLTAAVIVFAFGARTLSRITDWKSEDSLYTAAVRDAPDNARMRVDLAAVRFDQHRYTESINHCRHAATITPHWGLPYGCIALALDRLGQEHSAARAFGQMLSLSGVEPRWWLEAARFCVRTRRLRTARAIIDRLRAQHFDSPDLNTLENTLAHPPP